MRVLLALLFAFGFATNSLAFSERARATAAQTDICGGLKTALGMFFVDNGRYPTTTEGLAALIKCPPNLEGPWHGPYLYRIPIDPWGSPYVYVFPGIHNLNGYDLYSRGPDGVSHSQGNDPDDVNNWDPSSPHVRYQEEISLGPWKIPLVSLLVISMLWIARTINSERPFTGATFAQKLLAQLPLALWFGPGFLIILQLCFDFPPCPWLNLVCLILWWAAGLGFAVSGLRSRSTIGRFAGLLSLLELFGLTISLLVPRIA